ncbi:MAG: TIGR03915 family putative DNA repair protein [Oscillospiraceae bacterium]|nr:TIGR03915 family putative DNA repair protein [Oscillospiraceae bacterium]
MRQDWTQVSYRYDGSYAGFLTCVYESFKHFEEPMAFCAPEEDRCSLYPERPVETEPGHAKQIYRSLREKASKEVQRMVSHGFLTDLHDKECVLWQFIRMAYDIGPGVIYWITDDRVHKLDKALRAMYNEAHLLKGFTRFSDCRGLLWAQISPKNRVLPILRPHFCDRFHTETFLIFDDVHHEALVHAQGQWAIRPVDSIQFPASDAKEEDYRRLWQKFYDTVAIEGRYNPKLRMSNVPKRYWHHMTELKGELASEGLVEVKGAVK